MIVIRIVPICDLIAKLLQPAVSLLQQESETDRDPFRFREQLRQQARWRMCQLLSVADTAGDPSVGTIPDATGGGASLLTYLAPDVAGGADGLPPLEHIPTTSTEDSEPDNDS